MEIYSIILLLLLVLSLSIIAFLSICLLRESGKNRKKRIVLKSGNIQLVNDSSPETARCRKVALLIDGDNISPKTIGRILENVGKTEDSVIVFSCIYALENNMGKWLPVARDYDIQLRYITNCIKGKNTTDFSIVIDCMDLLYTADIDTFVLCSSDSDYSGIVSRIRAEGRTAIGMGNSATPKDFRKGFSVFFRIDEKETSIDTLESTLGKLVTYYGFKAPYNRIKDMISQRFELNQMGFKSFDSMLNHFGFNNIDDRFIVLAESIPCSR